MFVRRISFRPQEAALVRPCMRVIVKNSEKDSKLASHAAFLSSPARVPVRVVHLLVEAVGQLR
jgi:hypothetical protein